MSGDAPKGPWEPKQPPPAVSRPRVEDPAAAEGVRYLLAACQPTMVCCCGAPTFAAGAGVVLGYQHWGGWWGAAQGGGVGLLAGIVVGWGLMQVLGGVLGLLEAS